MRGAREPHFGHFFVSDALTLSIFSKRWPHFTHLYSYNGNPKLLSPRWRWMQKSKSGLRYPPKHRDFRFAQDMLHHSFPEPRCVVIEVQEIGLFVEAEL